MVTRRIIGALLFGMAAHVAAQGLAAKPVRIVVNLPPGSSMDLVARAVADAMAQDGGAAVMVENRPGGAGVLAAEAVARSPADGHTLLVSGVDAIVFAFIAANRKPLDPFKDFTP